MLQAMRSGAHSKIIKFVLFGLLVLGVGGLVLSDIGGVFRQGVGSTDVAKVGDEAIGLRKFDTEVRSILRRQGLDPQMAYQLGYIDQILMGEIQDILIRKSAAKLGISVSDKDVATHISRLVEPLLDENTTPQQALNRITATQGISERQFVNSVRFQLANSILKSALQAGASIIPNELTEDLYLYDHETREIDYFVIEEKDFTDIDEPDEDALAEFYNAMKEQYAIPERRTINIAVLDADKVQSDIEIPEEELKAIYEENATYYVIPEKRKMAQAIVETQDVAQAIFEKAASGKPLQNAVRDVTGSTEHYLDVQTYEREGLIENVADIVFSLEPGNVAEPVQTPLGWHVIKVTEIEPSGQIPFAEIKEDIRKEQKQTVVADRLYDLAGEVDDLIAGGAGLEEAIKQFQLEKTTVEMIDVTGKTPEGTDALKAFSEDREYILETSFALMEEEISPVIELAGGDFAIVKAEKIQPKSWKPFEDVQEDLIKKWTKRAQKLAVMRKADRILTGLQEGASLEDIAKEEGYSIKTISLERQGEPGKIFDASARMRFFPLKEGEYTSAGTTNGQIIGQVSKINLPNLDNIGATERATYEQALQRILPNELLQAYIGSLTDRYQVKINRALLQKAYGGEEQQ